MVYLHFAVTNPNSLSMLNTIVSNGCVLGRMQQKDGQMIAKVFSPAFTPIPFLFSIDWIILPRNMTNPH